MKQVKILEDTDYSTLEQVINVELEKWDAENTELQFTQALNNEELIYACMIIIKDVRK